MQVMKKCMQVIKSSLVICFRQYVFTGCPSGMDKVNCTADLGCPVTCEGVRTYSDCGDWEADCDVTCRCPAGSMEEDEPWLGCVEECYCRLDGTLQPPGHTFKPHLCHIW